MNTVIDYAAGVPRASAVRDAGHIGAVRYLAPDRTGGSLPAKPILASEKADYDANGLELAYVWQYGKDHDSDVRRGRLGGQLDAQASLERLSTLGVGNQPVFFAVDYDISIDEWNRFGAEYFRGAAEVLGVERVGIYGHSRVCAWAVEDGVVGSAGGGKHLCWVTKAWSAGDRGEEYAVLYQGDGGSVDGVGIDINEVLHDNWGQIPVGSSSSAPVPVVVDDPGYDEDQSWKISFGGPAPAPKRVIIVHTTENQLGTHPGNVIDYQVKMRNGSYHRIVGLPNSAPLIVLANTDDWQVWATGNILNDTALHVSIAWWAANTREEWLSEPDILKAVARVIAFWSRTYGIPLRKLSREELGAGESGVAGHLEAQVFGNTDHWDPGYEFPYDVVLAMAEEINSAPAAIVQAEQNFMEVFMADRIKSLINPDREFEPGTMLSIVDATGWETHKAMRGLYEALGIDFDAFIQACKQADLAGEPVPAVTAFIK